MIHNFSGSHLHFYCHDDLGQALIGEVAILLELEIKKIPKSHPFLCAISGKASIGILSRRVLASDPKPLTRKKDAKLIT